MGLLSIVPLPYRLVAIAALPLAGFAAGWWKAAEHYHLKDQLDADAREKAVLTASLQGAQRHAQDLQNSKDRAATLATDLASARTLTAGMADRLRLQTQLHRSASPTASPGCGAEHSDPEGAARLQRLFGRQQQVLDLASQCGAALEALGSKPLCECSKP